MIGKTLGHYQIVDKIGAGGMGEVYRARDTKLGRDVAVKVLPPEVASDAERRKRFDREARLIASLKHPNIVTIYGVDEIDGHPFLAMELVEGRTLGQILPDDGLSLDRFFKIAIPLAEAIHSAHAAGITHRDLKPSNVMIDADGRVKVLDFGLAKLFEAPDGTADDSETVVGDSDTQEGRVLGTTSYMSPEQAEGKQVDQRSDIFALGILLYEMATGQRPFKGDSSLSILSSLLKDTPSTVTEVRHHLPVQLGRIVAHCLEKDPRKRFQSALDVANELEALQVEVSSSTGAVEPLSGPGPSLGRRFGIPGAVVLVVAIAAILIFKPFTMEVSPDQAAEASGNTLAIMYFENLVDPGDAQRHGEIVSELMITGLSESDYLKVVSSQRLYDILKQLGKENEKSIDRDTATDVATRAGARWMMQGRILQVEPAFVITSQIVEVGTGNVAASQRITGRPGESIFALVDRMTVETLDDLSEPGESPSPPASVASVSTDSEEAYRHYLAGLEYERKFYNQEARERFREAIAADSSFTMAYVMLSEVATGNEQNWAIDQALTHRDRATARDRMYLRALEARRSMDVDAYVNACEAIVAAYPQEKMALAWLAAFHRVFLNDLEAAIDYTNRILELDPLDKLSYNKLAYTYTELGNYDKAIWAINKYIELAPDEANPYDSRGDIYARFGHIDEAIASYNQAVAIKPDFGDYASVANLGDLYVFRGEYEKAAAQYRRMFASPDADVRARGRGHLISIPLYRGKVEAAVAQIDAAITTDKVEGVEPQTHRQRLLRKSQVLYRVGEVDAAYEAYEKAAAIPSNNPSPFDTIFQAFGLASIGRTAEATEILEGLAPGLESGPDFFKAIWNLARGVTALVDEDFPAAVTHLEQVDKAWFGARFPLAQAYVGADRPSDAIPILERMTSRYSSDRLHDPPLPALVHYVLGKAYEKAGRADDAIEQFTTFLDIWKDADPRLEALGDARARLERLKSSS